MSTSRQRIAVVGAGISGLGAAWLLAREHEVVVFEKEVRAGGHAHTHTVDTGTGPLRVDTGFLVYNNRTYPGFVRLLERLGVEGQDSDMSFGLRCRRCALEYSTRGLPGLFAQPRRAVDPGHLRLLADLPRFHRHARAFLGDGSRSDATLGDFLQEGRYSDGFVRHHLLPMGSAVWSAPGRDIKAFSARSFLQFFANHGWLALNDTPRWRTVRGGSATYVAALTRDLDVRTGSGAVRVERRPHGVVVEAEGGGGHFDAVVMATHADTTLRLLADADAHETAALSLFRYSTNRTVLHTDRTALPLARGAWASWNCDLLDCGDEDAPASLTYHLNRLQALPGPTEYCVTLNGTGTAAGTLAEMQYTHPILDAGALRGQALLRRLSGRRRTYFAGAHLRYGFHEDGFQSAVDVARLLGVRDALATAA